MNFNELLVLSGRLYECVQLPLFLHYSLAC